MALKKKKSSKLTKLNVFANSPKVVKLFGPLIILLVIVALGYGGYTLLKENSSDAASKQAKWNYNSKGISHRSGKLVTDFTGGKAWYAGPKDLGHVWFGPYTSLPKSKQYLACFYYTFWVNGSQNTNVYGEAIIDIVNNANNSRPTQTWRRDTISSNSIPQKPLTYNRTCLAFYVPKSNVPNEVEFRVEHLKGHMLIKEVRISQVPKKKNSLYGISFMKSGPNNSAIFHDKGFFTGKAPASTKDKNK